MHCRLICFFTFEMAQFIKHGISVHLICNVKSIVETKNGWTMGVVSQDRSHRSLSGTYDTFWRWSPSCPAVWFFGWPRTVATEVVRTASAEPSNCTELYLLHLNTVQHCTAVYISHLNSALQCTALYLSNLNNFPSCHTE